MPKNNIIRIMCIIKLYYTNLWPIKSQNIYIIKFQTIIFWWQFFLLKITYKIIRLIVINITNYIISHYFIK